MRNPTKKPVRTPELERLVAAIWLALERPSQEPGDPPPYLRDMEGSTGNHDRLIIAGVIDLYCVAEAVLKHQRRIAGENKAKAKVAK